MSDQASLRIRRTKLLAAAAQIVRVTMVGLLLAMLPAPRTSQVDNDATPPVDLAAAALALELDEASLVISDQPNGSALWTLGDQNGQTVGYVARTLPAGARAVGYRGPTEAMLLLDTKLNVVQATLLRSEDTPEHVRAVDERDSFLQQFKGLKLGEVDSAFQVHGVSGATLTSLAMAKGILLRLGGDRPSLFFPDELELKELTTWKLKPDELEEARSGQRLLRTGVLCDDVVGYQGPSEAAVLLDQDDRVRKIKLVRSFDNQPYVGYVKDDRYYWEPFVGKTLAEVAKMDLEAEGIEGVSGATMTSIAAAQTVIQAAKKLNEPKVESKAAPATIRWSVHEVATVLIIGLALLCAGTKLFRYRLLRTAWLLLVVIVIGFWTGNLVSLALVAGWSIEGVAWQLAPGLAVMGLIALIAPPLSKGNPYCNHMCPHGALQQLIRPGAKSKRRFTVPKKMESALVWLPGILVTAAYLAVLLRPNVNLARWEPFQAYLVQIASWSTIAFAVVSLIAASMIPMAYCRYGCATGRLLDYLRRSAKSHRLTLPDGVVTLLAIVAMVVRMKTS